MLPIWLYLTTLFIAPQLWIEPFVGWRTDFIVYPFWFLWLAGRGRLGLMFRLRTQDWMLLGFVVWVIISMHINPPPAEVDDLTQKYIKWFVLYRLTAASIDSPATLRKITWAVMALVGLVSIEAAQHLASDNGIGWAGQSFAWVDPSAASVGVKNRTRWINIFDGPGVFCVMFTLALPMALQYIAKAYSWPMRIFAGLVLVPLFGYATFTTGSRGGFLTALAIVGFWLMSRYKISLRRIVASGVIGMAGLMLGPAYLTSTTDSSNSAQHRVDMWGEGIEMVQSNPVFGIGRGNFANYTGLLIAHNSGIEMMGETGFVGVFFWFSTIYLGFRNLVVRTGEKSADPKERELMIGVGLALLGYMVSSLFVTLEFETLYFMLGMTAGVANYTEQPAAYRKRDAKITGAIILTFFVAMKLFVMSYF